jgi:WD40 repeat protein
MDEPHNANHNDNDDVQDDDEDHSQQEPQQQYILDGVEYDSYQEMVDAKRKRNQQVLQGLGFLDSTKAPKLQKASSSSTKSQASQRGIKRQKVVETEPAFKRTSSRLSGVKTGHVALDYNAVNWSSGKADKMIVQVEGEGGVGDGNVAGGVVRVVDNYHEKAPTYFNGRVNDGSDLTITDAVELVERKWVKDDSVEAAVAFAKNLVVRQNAPPQKQTSTKKNSKLLAAADSYDDLQPKFNALSIDKEEWVAKVTPDRIYSVSAHPSESKLIVAAGDKQGYVGLWDVDHYASATTTDNNNHHHHNGVYLFRPHARPICCLEWSSPSTLISASYDGTVRCFNAETETFTELFATYDDSNTFYIEELGYGLDQGYRYWTQSVSLDTRNSANRSNPCLFLSTSVGTAMHVDLRIKDKQKITFHETLSEKKINTLR